MKRLIHEILIHIYLKSSFPHVPKFIYYKDYIIYKHLIEYYESNNNI